MEPVIDRIAPYDGVPGLISKLCEHILKTGIIDKAAQRFPFRDESTGRLGAVVMRIIDSLNYGFSGMQFVCVGHMMEEQDQGVRCADQRFIYLLDIVRVLTDKPRPCGDAAVHADSL